MTFRSCKTDKVKPRKLNLEFTLDIVGDEEEGLFLLLVLVNIGFQVLVFFAFLEEFLFHQHGVVGSSGNIIQLHLHLLADQVIDFLSDESNLVAA